MCAVDGVENDCIDVVFIHIVKLNIVGKVAKFVTRKYPAVARKYS